MTALSLKRCYPETVSCTAFLTPPAAQHVPRMPHADATNTVFQETYAALERDFISQTAIAVALRSISKVKANIYAASLL